MSLPDAAYDGRLWRWYAQTEVRISLAGDHAFTVAPAPAGTVGRWPWGDAPEVWILTACNPRSVPLCDADNRARHVALGNELKARSVLHVEAIGYDPDDPGWSELGYCVLGLPESHAVAISRRWEQNAAFSWTPQAWSIVGVLLPGRTDLGWTLTANG